MNVKLHSITPEIEETIVEVARVSSTRKDKRNDPWNLINYLIKNHHWSPFEHGFITMEIETSRAICVQFLRHRSFTFQQFSLRYAAATKFENINIREQADRNRQSSTTSLTNIYDSDKGLVLINESKMSEAQFDAVVKARNALSKIKEAYDEMLDSGIAKETARFILPLATQTTFYMTGPVRSWIHMIQLREDPHAQKEAQDIAEAMKEVFIENLPLISKALEWK